MATVEFPLPPAHHRGHAEEPFAEEGYSDDLREEMAWLRARYLEQREELLAQRSLVQRCLELREVVEAHLLELGDRAAELDLSLAGVSDSTARHGKAISALVDQHRHLFLLLQQAPQFGAALQSLAHNSASEGRLQSDHQGTIQYNDDSGHGRPFPNAWRDEGFHGATNTTAGKNLAQSVPPEMADCVASVLARIEEALTKLSGRPECNFNLQPDSPDSACSSHPGQEQLHNVPKQDRPSSAPRPPRNLDPKHHGRNPGTSQDQTDAVPSEWGYLPSRRRSQPSGQSMAPKTGSGSRRT